MSQKTIDVFINEAYSKPPKKNYATNKTVVYHIDDIWSLDIVDLTEVGVENNRSHRYVLVVVDIFSKFRWTNPLKNKKAQTIKNASENVIKSSKRQPNLIETYRGKQFYTSFFKKFQKTKTLNTILKIHP